MAHCNGCGRVLPVAHVRTEADYRIECLGRPVLLRRRYASIALKNGLFFRPLPVNVGSLAPVAQLDRVLPSEGE
ncbi:MAG: hypothetical protein FWG26_10475 [Betaproteobacteria bacterium]|nr:hypothetical protein [Betaproteobacteria bacterium]